MISDAGKSIRFPVESVRPQGRIAGGVRGMKIENKEKIVAMVLAYADKDSYLLVASQKVLVNCPQWTITELKPEEVGVS